MIEDNDQNLRTSEPQNLTPFNRSRLWRALKSASLFFLGTLGCFLFVFFALTEAEVDPSDYQVLTIQNSHEHGFEYWESGDGTMNPLTNSARIINFLDSHVK